MVEQNNSKMCKYKFGKLIESKKIIIIANKNDEQFKKDEQIIISSGEKLEVAELFSACINHACEKHSSYEIVKRILPEDQEKIKRLKEKEKKAFRYCNNRIQIRQLPIKLIRVEFLIDSSKAIFYYTAEGRIDFRELVKDLAGRFKMRIEMRQIGIRDQAKLMGGIGPCGRQLCCCTFIKKFEPVSIRIAKRQGLGFNINKISGVCGRLMCCLEYEKESYLASSEAETIEIKETDTITTENGGQALT